MRIRLALLLCLIGILFPAVWLKQFSSSYERAFKAIFDAEWTHVAAHLALFATLAILLSAAFRSSAHRRTVPGILLTILLVGSLQEGLQFISQGVMPLRPLAFGGPVFDLGIDLAGGMAGLGIFYPLRLRINQYGKSIGSDRRLE